MSIPAMLMIAIMVGFFVMCAIRMLPIYFEYLSVKEIIEKVAVDYKQDEESIRDIRNRIEKLFDTNQIYAIKPRDVEVFRKEGQTHIDASYESRIPVFGRIDAVLKFDDLQYVAGQPLP